MEFRLPTSYAIRAIRIMTLGFILKNAIDLWGEENIAFLDISHSEKFVKQGKISL